MNVTLRIRQVIWSLRTWATRQVSIIMIFQHYLITLLENLISQLCLVVFLLLRYHFSMMCFVCYYVSFRRLQFFVMALSSDYRVHSPLFYVLETYYFIFFFYEGWTFRNHSYCFHNHLFIIIQLNRNYLEIGLLFF